MLDLPGQSAQGMIDMHFLAKIQHQELTGKQDNIKQSAVTLQISAKQLFKGLEFPGI